MAANQLRINGLEELRRALLALPPALVQEAGVIAHAQAEAMMREVAAAYPVKSGALRRGLSIELGSDAVSATARVRSRAYHAYLFEHGTGKNKGKKPGTFIPIAIQRRRIMLAAMIDLVERSGLHVSGAAG